MLENALRRGIYDAVTVVHSETSTGALNPIEELAEVRPKRRRRGDPGGQRVGASGAPLLRGRLEARLCADGLAEGACAAARPRARRAQQNVLERAKSKTDRGIYFDFLEFERNILSESDAEHARGLAAVRAGRAGRRDPRGGRRGALGAPSGRWRSVRGAGSMRWRPRHRARDPCWRRPGSRSPTVTTITLPEPWTGPKLVGAVKQRGYVVATGYGRLKDNTFRIGHMGDHTVDALEALLEAIEDAFA
jgi:hypothetical protein